MHITFSLLTFLLTSISLTIAQEVDNETHIMDINVNLGTPSSPCSNSIESISVNTSQTISVPGFGYHCYEPGMDYRQLPSSGLTCITRTDNQDLLPAGVTNLGDTDGHNDLGHWQCAISGWPTVNCTGQNEMAAYDVSENTYTWTHGGVQSFEVQCQYTNVSAQGDSSKA